MTHFVVGIVQSTFFVLAFATVATCIHELFGEWQEWVEKEADMIPRKGLSYPLDY